MNNNFCSVPFVSVKMTGKTTPFEGDERTLKYNGDWQAAIGANVGNLATKYKHFKIIADTFKKGKIKKEIAILVPETSTGDKIRDMKRNFTFYEVSRKLLINFFDFGYVNIGSDLSDYKILIIPEYCTFGGDFCGIILDLNMMSDDEALIRLRPFREIRVFTDVTDEQSFVCSNIDTETGKIVFIAQGFMANDKAETRSIIINIKGKYIPKKIDTETGEYNRVSYRILDIENETEIFYDLYDTESLLIDLTKTEEVSSDIKITCPGCLNHKKL